MPIKCLMIETPDKKRLFTNIGSRRQLDACCRAFSAKVQVVRANLKRSQLLTIPKLVVAICETNYGSNKTEFEVIKKENKSDRGRK